MHHTLIVYICHFLLRITIVYGIIVSREFPLIDDCFLKEDKSFKDNN